MKEDYPYYGKIHSGLVVYFTAPSTGVVVVGHNRHPKDESRTDWLEYNFTKIKFEGESDMQELKKKDYIIGSQLKGQPKTVSINAHPKVHTNFVAATSEAERLASVDTTKEFVVFEVKGIVSVPTPGPTWK